MSGQEAKRDLSIGSRQQTRIPVREFLVHRHPVFAFIGSSVAVVCSVATAFAYPIEAHDTYSPLNHFISELGRYGVSTTAALFNVGLMVTGMFFLLFVLGLGLKIATPLAWAATVAGSIAAAACSAVGVFPMNHLGSHLVAAYSFFYGGLLTMVLFSLAVGLDSGKSLPRGTAFIGSAAAVVFALFLFHPAFTRGSHPGTMDFDPLKVHRPPVWDLAVLEWLVFVAVIGWAVAVAGIESAHGARRGR